MDIVTAWKLEDGDSLPWLVSAYDEITESEHNGTPQFYIDDVDKARGKPGDGTSMRELVITVRDGALTELFELSVAPASTKPGRDL